MEYSDTVVVGVDGSPGSLAALEYALRDAGRRRARLRVIAAAPLPEYWENVYEMPGGPSAEEFVEDMRGIAQKTVSEVLAQRPDLAAVPVTVEARSGTPGNVLVEAADGAEVLVIGHRGLGAFRSALLGSVGLYCVLHATCPVTIVRPEEVAGTSVPRPFDATAKA